MFDYFRYVADELNGIDGEKAAQFRKEKEEREKAEIYIFSKKAKLLFKILGLFFFIVSIFTLLFIKETDSDSILNVIITILQGIVSVEVAICMVIKKEKAELWGLVGMGLFVLLLLISIAL